MLILGIETSCDDTAAALVEVRRGHFVVHKNIVASQAKLHAKYKGVVPEVAARAHLETIVPVLHEVFPYSPTPPTPPRAGGDINNPLLSKEGLGVVLDAIAVTAGPGLITSLLVGVETAKALSYAWDVPLVGVNHIEGHLYSPLLPKEGAGVRSGKATRTTKSRPTLTLPSPLKGEVTLEFPAIALIVSGGHTELILMTGHGQYKLLGRTRDDAAGETFDKAAVMLGLPYPGGPEIAKRAATGNPTAFPLPRPMLDRPDFEFSFSGLKNAIRLLIENLKKSPLLSEERVRVRSGGATSTTQAHPTLTLPSPLKGEGMSLNNLCASIEQAIVDVLVAKSLTAVAKHHPKTFILAGGVAANKKLRATLRRQLPKTTNFLLPAHAYCQDNAAMIAAAAHHHIKNKNFARYDKLGADANWELV